MLDKLSELQRTLMKVLDVPHVEGLPFWLQPAFREAMIGIAQEALETHEAAGAMTKPWKSPTVDHVKEELVDVLFYWLEGVVVSGMTFSEIEAIYLDKYVKNLKRVINSEYSDPVKKVKAFEALEDFENEYKLGSSGWEHRKVFTVDPEIIIVDGDE